MFASAESFTVSEYAGDPVLRTMDAAKLDEAKEAIIATLPEDMRDKDFTLTSSGDETGKNFALVSHRYADPSEIQQLIDDGLIDPISAQSPQGYTVKVEIADGIIPIAKTETGDFVNALSGRSVTSTNASYSSTTQNSGWQYYTASDSTTLGVRVSRYVYINNSNPLDVLERPISIWGTYSRSGSHTATNMEAVYSGTEASIVKFPDYFNGDYTVISTGYTLRLSVASPTSQQIYQQNAYYASNRAIDCSNSQDLLAGASIYINNRRLDFYLAIW